MLLKYQKFPLFSYIIQGENYLNWILTLLNTRFGQVADSTFSWLYCLAIVALTMPIWQYLVFPMGSLSTKDICDGRPGTFLNCDFSLSLKSESACSASNKWPHTKVPNHKKVPNRAFSLLKAPTSTTAFTFRHYS